MATVSLLIARARLEIGDTATPFRCEIVGDGDSNILALSRSKVDATTLQVSVNGSAQTQGVDYTVDSKDGLLVFVTPPPVDAYVLAVGNCFQFFDDTDMTTFVNTAFQQHIYNRRDQMQYAMTLASLPPIEEYLVAILAVIQALWVLATSAAFDIDISTPEGVHIPRSERYSQLKAIIDTRQAQYTALAEQLNVGLGRFEVFDNRRVSKSTGKLVPIYLPQEYEDNRPPTRIFPEITTMGQPVNTSAVEPPRVDLNAMSNQSFSQQLTGLGNLTGVTVRAHVRPYPGTLSSLALFTVVVTDTTNGVVTISLTPQQTYMLSANLFWDIESVDSQSNVKTLTFGTFTTDRQGQP